MPAFVRYWHKADKVEFWLETACPLKTNADIRVLSQLMLPDPEGRAITFNR
jgi:hypothetical protein